MEYAPSASSRAILRNATPADIPALIHLLRRSWLMVWAPQLPFEAVQTFAAADPVTDHVQAMWNCFVVATINTDIVGMLHVSDDCIENIHVDYEFWSTGTGSQLLKHAELEMSKRHATGRLEVRSFNRRAIDFYHRRGWSDFRRYPGFECNSPVENIEMRKPLRRSFELPD